MKIEQKYVDALETYLKYFQANVFKEITGGHMIALIKSMETSCEFVELMKKELEKENKNGRKPK